MKDKLETKLRKVPTYQQDVSDMIKFIKKIVLFLQMRSANRMNQAILRYKSLFQGFIIKNWQSVELSNRDEDYNKIIIKYCVLYYKKC